MTTPRIAIALVTHNRKALLEESILAITTQTVAVEKIVVVDNDSTDGTDELIKEKFSTIQNLEYIRSEENEGSAGGFNKAIKEAYDSGAEWIWCLDDDVAPRNNCLEILLSYSHISKCIHPNKVDINGNEFIWESVFDPATAKATFLNNISFKNGKDYTFMNMGCFEGMLIHRDIVKEIGYPDPRFFICSDDILYGFLASLYTNVILVKDAIIEKKFVFDNRPSPTFFYYYLRNQFLIKEYLKKYGFYKKHLFWLQIMIIVGAGLTKHTFFGKSWKVSLYVWKGFWDGVRGRFYKLKH